MAEPTPAAVERLVQAVPVPLDPRLLHALHHAPDADTGMPESLNQGILQLLAVASPRVAAPASRPWGVALAIIVATGGAGIVTLATYWQHAGPPLPPTVVAAASAPRVAAPASEAAPLNPDDPPGDPEAADPPASAAGPTASATASPAPAAVPVATAASAAKPAASAALPAAAPATASAAPPTMIARPAAPASPASAAASPPTATAQAASAASEPATRAVAAAATPAAPGPLAAPASAPPSRRAEGAAAWSKALQLPTLADVPWRLGLGFETINRIQLDGRTRDATARNCRELLAALDAGLLFSLDQDVPAANFEAVTCRAIALVGRAGRAASSYVEGFKLDTASVPRLPADVAAAVDAASTARLAAASARQQTLPTLFPDLRVRPQGETLLLAAGDWESRLHILARGDFDEDGQDDLLLSVIERTVDNRFENTKLFILTRGGADEPLRLVRRVH